jgi:hypothetical protein
MPLAGYSPETRTIRVGNTTSFDVRGLSLTDVAVLIREHFPDLDAIVDLFGDFDKITAADIRPVVIAIVSQAPGLAANVIALAAGEGDASDAAKLPGPVQVSALVNIGELTFTDVGGVGKAWETIAALLKNKEVMSRLTQAKSQG